MEDYKSRVKVLSDTFKGTAHFDQDFQEETDHTGGVLFHLCDAIYIYDKNKSPVRGHGKSKRKKEAEQIAYKEILDQLEDNGLPIQVEEKPLNKLRPISNPGQLGQSQSPPRFVTAAPLPSASTGAEVHQVTPDVEPLDDQLILDESTRGNKIGDLETFCAKANPVLPKPEFNLMNDWTLLPDNSHRFKMQCIVGGTIKYGVAINKLKAKKIAAFKMLQKLRHSVENRTDDLGISDLSISGREPSLTRARSVEVGKEAGASNLSFPISPERQIQTLPVSNGSMVQSRVSLPSRTRIVSGGTLVKDKIVYFQQDRLSENDSGSSGRHRSEVYKGYYETVEKVAAIKRVPLVKNDPKCDELKILRGLDHPNVVRYFCTEEKELYQFIAMELATSTLEKVVQTEKEMIVLREYTLHVTSGLCYLHEKNIIHRDLKPSNILIFVSHASKKVAKITDFDISREFDFKRCGITTTENRGTRTYMPPEAIVASSSTKSFKLEKTFDIFGLALVIHFAMTRGQHLFVHKEHEALCHTEVNITEGKANWKYTIDNPKFTALRNLLEAMIRKDPQRRPLTYLILEHPFFWDTSKGHQFLIDACTDISNANLQLKTTIKQAILEPRYKTYCVRNELGSEWVERTCPTVYKWIKESSFKTPGKGSSKNYDSSSIMKLIELIRDQTMHYSNWRSDGDLSSDSVFGREFKNFAKYFEDKFPELVTLVYTSLQQEDLQGALLKNYYVYNAIAAFSLEF